MNIFFEVLVMEVPLTKLVFLRALDTLKVQSFWFACALKHDKKLTFLLYMDNEQSLVTLQQS